MMETYLGDEFFKVLNTTSLDSFSSSYISLCKRLSN